MTWAKVRAAFRRRQVEREMEAELAEHVERETEDLIGRGVSPADARRQALAAMGRLEIVKEECRDSRGTAGWEQLKQDIAFGVRLLAKNRTFASIAVATMALGIGSTTAVFSLIDGVLLRPLAFPQPERLVFVKNAGFTRGAFDTLRAQSRMADYAAYMGVRSFNASGRELPERIKGCEVSANFFRVLGVIPLIGETFGAGDDRADRLPKVILRYEFWRERYNEDRGVIGQPITLDDVAYQIMGVMPAGFQYPAMEEARFWVPMRLDPRAIGDYWGWGGIVPIGRLRSGVSVEVARVELRDEIPRIRHMFPWRMPDAWGSSARLEGLRESLVVGARLRSLLLLGVVALVLMIAVVNVANLLGGQTAARQRELALRASLGATPMRLARQMLTEALVLGTTAGVVGTLLAFAQLNVLKHLLPADTPRLGEVAIDGRILAFSAVISLGSGLLFGLLPAWRIRKLESLVSLEGGRSTGGTGAARTDAVLVAAEAAFATILVVGAGLLLRSLWTLLQVDPGFRPESLVTAEVSPNREVGASIGKMIGVYEEVRTKLMGYPGVRNVGAANALPLTPLGSFFAAAIEDHPRPPQQPQYVLWDTAVTPEHLPTMGVRLLEGRGFTGADRLGAPMAVLISRSMAHRFWPDRSPLGRRLKPVWDKDWRTIVGVVEDVKNYSITGVPDYVDGEIYIPLGQPVDRPRSLAFVARLEGDPSDFEKRLPAMVNEVCPSCAVGKIGRMEAVVSDAVRAPRSTAWLVGVFAALALGLAAAGIYGVVSHRVLRRTREIGVRLALGASRGHIAWLVMGSSLHYTLVGAMAGLAASWALARWIRALLYGVASHDPLSFTVAPLVLVTAAAVAGLVPMRRAMRIDPAESLREE